MIQFLGHLQHRPGRILSHPRHRPHEIGGLALVFSQALLDALLVPSQSAGTGSMMVLGFTTLPVAACVILMVTVGDSPPT
jgi:hypothetical protein